MSGVLRQGSRARRFTSARFCPCEMQVEARRFTPTPPEAAAAGFSGRRLPLAERFLPAIKTFIVEQPNRGRAVAGLVAKTGGAAKKTAYLVGISIGGFHNNWRCARRGES